MTVRDNLLDLLKQGLSAEELVNSMRSYDLLQLYLAKNLAAGVFPVYPGDSISDTVAKAGEAYAANGIEQNVWAAPGVIPYDGPVPAGVTITYAAPPAVFLPSLTARDTGIMPVSPTPISWSCPLIAIRSDDCYTSWFVVDTGGTLKIGNVNVCPLTYARHKGVPISFGAITHSIDNGTWHFSKAQIRKAHQLCGSEIYSHAYSGAVYDPTESYATMQRDIIETRQTIESLTDTAYTPNALGLVCRGFVQPGSWEEIGHINTQARMDSPIARMIRQNYEWSMAEAWTARPGIRHYGLYHVNPAGLLTRYTKKPQQDTVVLMHGFTDLPGDPYPNSGIGVTVAAFKAMIDTIADWQALGYCRAVTLSTWFTGVKGTLPADYTGVINGDLDNLTAPVGGECVWLGADASFEATGGNPGACILLNAGDDSYANFTGVDALPGGSYLITLDAKKTTADADPTIGITIFVKDKAGTEYKLGGASEGVFGRDVTSDTRLWYVPGTFTEFSTLVGIPSWAYISNIRVYHWGTTPVVIDNLKCRRV